MKDFQHAKMIQVIGETNILLIEVHETSIMAYAIISKLLNLKIRIFTKNTFKCTSMLYVHKSYAS